MSAREVKVIVITGAAGLIGRSFSQAIADSGNTVVMADIDLAGVTNAAQQIGASALPLHLDITDASSVQQLFSTIQEQYGQIDGLVNNAYPKNPNFGRHVEEVSYEDFSENLSLHLGGYFHMMQQMVLHQKKLRRKSVIVNMASIYGVIAPRFEIYEGTAMTTPVEYAAIKSGVIQLTRYFAKYYRKDGIRVNAISPGGIEDGQPERFLEAYGAFCGTKGMLEPTDLSETLLFLLSDGARHITGQNIIVDDGFSL